MSNSSEDDSGLGEYADLMDAIDSSSSEEEENDLMEQSSTSEEEKEEEEEEENNLMEQSSTSEEEKEEEEEKPPTPPTKKTPVKKRKRKKKEEKVEKKIPVKKQKRKNGEKKTSVKKQKRENGEKKKSLAKKKKKSAARIITKATPPDDIPIALLGQGRFTRTKQRNPTAAKRDEGEDAKPINQLEYRHRILRTRSGMMFSQARSQRWMHAAIEEVKKSPLMEVMFSTPVADDRVFCISSNAKISGMMQCDSYIQRTAQGAHRVLGLRVRNPKPASNGRQTLGMLYEKDVDDAVHLSREFHDNCSRVFI